MAHHFDVVAIGEVLGDQAVEHPEQVHMLDLQGFPSGGHANEHAAVNGEVRGPL